MDDSIEMSNEGILFPYKFPPKSPGSYSTARFDFPLHSVAPSSSIYTDTVAIFVNSDWGSLDNASFGPSFSQSGQIQLCPALFVPTAQNIPQAVKHIYSRLASAAKELDQGVPELLLSLAGNENSLNFEVCFNLFFIILKKFF